MKTERRIWGQYTALSNEPMIEITSLEEQKIISNNLLRSTDNTSNSSQNYLRLHDRRGKKGRR